MKRIAPVIALAMAVVAVTLTVSARAQSPAEVVAVERAFAADARQRGWVAAFKTYSAPDAFLLRADPINAKDSLAKLPDTPAETALNWWPLWAGIAQSGDLGFTTGPYAAGEKNFGHYFTVWERQADGSWRWIYDGGPANAAASPFGPESVPEFLPVATTSSANAPAAWAEVAALEAQLATAALRNTREAFLAVLAPEARIMGSPAQPAIGRARHMEELETRGPSLQLTPIGGKAARAGDLVFTYGRAAWSHDGQARRGHYVRIWQHRPGGWRLVFDELLAAPPAAQP